MGGGNIIVDLITISKISNFKVADIYIELHNSKVAKIGKFNPITTNMLYNVEVKSNVNQFLGHYIWYSNYFIKIQENETYIDIYNTFTRTENVPLTAEISNHTITGQNLKQHIHKQCLYEISKSNNTKWLNLKEKYDKEILEHMINYTNKYRNKINSKLNETHNDLIKHIIENKKKFLEKSPSKSDKVFLTKM